MILLLHLISSSIASLSFVMLEIFIELVSFSRSLQSFIYLIIFCILFFLNEGNNFRPSSEYLTFTNITLVSQHGLPTVGDCSRAAEICVPRDGRYSDQYIKSVPYYYYVDIMTAVMVKIDRYFMGSLLLMMKFLL